MKWLTKKLKQAFNLQDFNEIVIEQDVIDDIIRTAKETHPKEFVTLLKGEIKNNQLRINGLLYQVYEASNDATVMRINLPITSGFLGSVHSHPSHSNRPSEADHIFFNKHGILHLIICMPFEKYNIAAYNRYGEKIDFNIS
ncbi:MAG: hypothetical protein GY861_06295 [bacterium]|nr:hypothetical protein [bacterium]